MRSLAFKISACLVMLVACASCTYDYFEDDMNYKVFVPEFRDGLLTDCRVMIWDTETGKLVGDRYARTGETRDNLVDLGIFPFRIAPGNYKVMVLTNTDSVEFRGHDDLASAAFALSSKDDGIFKSPAMMYFQYIPRELELQGKLVVDTAQIEQYPARITVRYRGGAVSADACKKVKMRLSNIGHEQYVKLDTLTSGEQDRHSDYWYNEIEPYPLSGEGARFETSCLLFPSKDNEMKTLIVDYKTSDDNILAHYVITLLKTESEPLILRHGEHAIIDIYNEGFTFTINGWSDNISGSEVGGSSDPNHKPARRSWTSRMIPFPNN